jgi:hypothetical protein
MLNPQLSSILVQFDECLAIYAFSTFEQQSQFLKD